MKVRAIFESGVTRVVLTAETEEEKLMLGVLGADVEATTFQHHEGHVSYRRVATTEIHLRPATKTGSAS